MIKFTMNIGGKLILTMALLIVAVMSVTLFFIGLRAQTIVEQYASELAKETAYHHAAIIKIDLETALDEARALAHFFEAVLQEHELQLTRNGVNSILKHFIESNPQFLAVYVAFEPNAFDGKDSDFINTWGHDKTGRLVPYWTRNEKGQGVLEPLKYYEQEGQGDYYHLPKKHKREAVIDPYLYPIQGKEVLMTSLVVPIFNKQNTFIGIAGIDLAFENIQNKINQMKLAHFKNGFINFYASNGVIIAAKNPIHIGKNVAETSDNQIFIERILAKEVFVLNRFSRTLKNEVLTYGVPVKVGHTDNPWMITVNIPQEELDAEIQRMTLLITLIGLVAILIAIGIVYMLAKTLSHPLKNLVKISQAIAEGNLNNHITWHNQDEIGQLLHSFDQMQTQLRERLLEEKKTAEETLRINQALNNVNTSVLIADNNYRIIYANRSAQRLFEENQPIIRKKLPHFNAGQLLGSPIEEFHSHPLRQHDLLEHLTTTHHVTLNFDGLNLDAKINPVINVQGQRLGWVTEFVDRTTEITTEQEVNAVMTAASSGDFSQRIDLEDKTGFFKTFSQSLNQTLDYTQKMIEELKNVFAALAYGDLSQTISQNYTGALELLKNDVNTTIATLTHVISTVKQSAEVVNHAVEEISQGNADLSHRTEEQASSLEETAASMEEMTGSVQRSSDHVQHAKSLAEKARDYALQGGNAVNSVIEAMQKINTSSKKMSESLAVINEIAFQTNLLALNAAVEAARAGEQGRGFAVVAGEVRNLAQRSAEAAKEIKKLIEESIHEVEEGTRLVNQSGATLQDIMTAVKKVSDIVTEVATSGLEQTSGIQQVNKVIIQLDEMTQQNAALVEQAASTSESLKEQARLLKERVSFFKINLLTEDFSLPSNHVLNSEPSENQNPSYESEWETF